MQPHAHKFTITRVSTFMWKGAQRERIFWCCRWMKAIKKTFHMLHVDFSFATPKKMLNFSFMPVFLSSHHHHHHSPPLNSTAQLFSCVCFFSCLFYFEIILFEIKTSNIYIFSTIFSKLNSITRKTEREWIMLNVKRVGLDVDSRIIEWKQLRAMKFDN